MSASFQTLPQPGTPPPGVIYPTTTTTTTITNQPDTSARTSGSFGMVFVVLAIIFVISAVACVLGRICSKKASKSSHHPKAHKQQSHSHGPSSHHHKSGHGHHDKHQKSNHKDKDKHKHGKGKGRPRDPDLEFGYRSKEGDIMMGFEPKIKIPSSKVAANNSGDFRGDHHQHQGMGPMRGMGPMGGMGMGSGRGMDPRAMDHHGHEEYGEYP